MRFLCIVLPVAAVLSAAPAARSPFAGRWDLTITAGGATYPGWLEVAGKEVRVQPRSGTVRPATDVKMTPAGLSLTVTPAKDDRPAVSWALKVEGGRITGTQKRGNETGQVAGVRAPELKRPAPKAWTTPEPLFNGKDLSGWEPDRPSANHWVAKAGLLVDETKGANLCTTRKFDDFKLHVEFNCPQDGNSGIYLRGRYEVQIEYSPVDADDPLHCIGSIYGFLGPNPRVPRRPGQWESFDITLVGRLLTLVHDGVKTIDNREIPGITGGALDSQEAEPGPFYIQGDHTGGMKFRNITISVPKQ